MDERQDIRPAARPGTPAASRRARALGWGGVGAALAVQSGVLWVAQGNAGDGAALLAGTAVASLGLAALAWGFALRPGRSGATEPAAPPASPEARAEELSGIFEALPVGVVATDQHGQIRWWNQGACVITGFGAQEVLGLPRGAIFAAKARPTATAERIHCPLRCKGGGWVVASVWAAPVPGTREGHARKVEVFVAAEGARAAPTPTPEKVPPPRPERSAAPPECRTATPERSMATPGPRPDEVGLELHGPLARVAALTRALGDGPLFPEEAAAARAILDEVSRIQRRLPPPAQAREEDPDEALRDLVAGLDRL